MDRTPLLTFSRLRWDFVYQRPQHVMTRLGTVRPVLFVEEPLEADTPRLEIHQVAPGVRVARPHLTTGGTAFGDAQQVQLESLLRTQLTRDGWRTFAAWIYAPMAVRIAKALRPTAILYDCMDELSNFMGAPPELLEREKELLAAADAVMTGGPSLFLAKSEQHSFVRCFPSSVDVRHFSVTNAGPEPEDQCHLPRPLLGYCGVVDERMDPVVLAAVADAHPDWQIVVLGPVVKIDPLQLPQRANIHYLGRKEYAELPSYLAGWDVAMMPFAIGPATRYISPTKVLEYLAADRPTVSTPIADVVQPYENIVYIGDGPDGFVSACEQALQAPLVERERRRRRAQDVLRRTSWDQTARRMNEIIRYLADPIPSQAVPAPLYRSRLRHEVRA
jgi:UDP-galactopyranose mutase